MSFFHYSDLSVKRLISHTLGFSWSARNAIVQHVSGQKPVVVKPEGGYHNLLKLSNVRASSLVCLLGVGIGVSSYLLYRFWNKIFPPPPPARLPLPHTDRKSRPHTPTSLAREDGGRLTSHKVLLDSPDSGCLTMGNTDSNPNSATITPSSPTINQKAVDKDTTEHSRLPEEDDISETEYESFVVINRGGQKNKVTIGSPGQLEYSSQLTESYSVLEMQDASSSHEACKETVLSSLQADNQEKGLLQPGVSGKAGLSDSTNNHMYASMTSTMQGSIMSTASTDLGFVSGNNDHSRETSQEPGQYSLESFNPSFNLDLNSNPAAQGPILTTRQEGLEGETSSSSARHLHKRQTMHDLTSFSAGSNSPRKQQGDYSLSEFLHHPTHMSDSSVLYSFLEDSNDSSGDIARPQSQMLVTPPLLTTRARSDGGHQSEPEVSFAAAPMKHSTPHFDNSSTCSDEVFRHATRAPIKKQMFPHRMKKTHSFTSEMSTTSDASYYLWGGNSVDMGENFSGRSTPDIDALKSEDFIGGQTEQEINEIQNQILGLRAELDDMNEHVQTLSSRDNLSYLPEIDGVVMNEVIRGSRMPKLSQVHKRFVSQMSNDASSVQSISFSEDGSELRRSTSQNQGDFMWDYQSDLASGYHQNFVARRPVVGDIVEGSPERQESPLEEHMKKYLQQQSDSVHINNSDSSGRNVSDLYIDDGFSFHQSYFPAKSRVQVAHVGVMATGGLSPVIENREDFKAEKRPSTGKSDKLCSQCQSDCCTNCGKSLNVNNNNDTKGKSNSEYETKSTHSTQTESSKDHTDLYHDSSLFAATASSNTNCAAVLSKSPNCCAASHHQCHTPPHCGGLINTNCSSCDSFSAPHCSLDSRIQPHDTMMAMAPCGYYNGTPCKHISPTAAVCHSPVAAFNTGTPSHLTSSPTSQQQPRGHPISVSTPACCHGNTSPGLRSSHSGCHGNNLVHNHQPNCYQSHHHHHQHQQQQASIPFFKNNDSIDHSMLDYSALIQEKPCVDETDSALDSGMSQSYRGVQFCAAAAGSPMVLPTTPPSIRDLDHTENNTESLNNNVLLHNQKSDSIQSAISSPSKSCVEEDQTQSIMLEKPKWEVTNIGSKHQIGDYVKQEWKGSTGRAEVMRQGYEQIPSLLSLSSLRVIRGDNYCALRATLYQILVNRLPVHNHIGSLQAALNKLDLFKSKEHCYLQKWTFANRLPHDKTQVYQTAKQCLQTFFEQIQLCQQLDSPTERERHLIESLNSRPDLDLQLLEAVKCLMMLNVITLYEKSQAGEDVPVFVWLLFARDTSENPEQFLRNHLNKVGDSGGLEQVEMFLLGYTLGVRITVVRPSQFSKEDFVTHFPSEGADGYPRVHLVAEDDRHYNALV